MFPGTGERYIWHTITCIHNYPYDLKVMATLGHQGNLARWALPQRVFSKIPKHLPNVSGIMTTFLGHVNNNPDMLHHILWISLFLEIVTSACQLIIDGVVGTVSGRPLNLPGDLAILWMIHMNGIFHKLQSEQPRITPNHSQCLKGCRNSHPERWLPVVLFQVFLLCSESLWEQTICSLADSSYPSDSEQKSAIAVRSLGNPGNRSLGNP